MQTIRLFIKKNYPVLYNKIRQLLYPIYEKISAKKRRTFTSRTDFTVSYGGVRFELVLEPKNGFVDAEIFTKGVYEPDILDVIKQHLPVGGTFVDIGANIGQHSLFAAVVAGPQGSVLSFEPIPRLVTQFQESINRNNLENRVTILPFACGDKNEHKNITVKTKNIGGSGFHNTFEPGEQIPVLLVRADDYLKAVEKIDCIKIDTEGHEIETLTGLADTLEHHQPTLLIEFSPSFWRSEAFDYSNKFFTIMNQHGYNCHDLEAGHKIIENTHEWVNAFTKLQTNLLCIPKV